MRDFVVELCSVGVIGSFRMVYGEVVVVVVVGVGDGVGLYMMDMKVVVALMVMFLS